MAAVIGALASVACLATGCTGRGGSPTRDALLYLPVPTSVTVAARHVAGLGTIIVDGQGRTLYMFPPDAGGRVSCAGTCAATWPPLVIADGHQPQAGPGVIGDDLATLADPNSGARVVTYGGYPLYRYTGDVAAGTANGQALFNNGGPWYTLDTGSNPITTDPASIG